jgi:hypothetical protein
MKAARKKLSRKERATAQRHHDAARVEAQPGSFSVDILMARGQLSDASRGGSPSEGSRPGT